MKLTKILKQAQGSFHGETVPNSLIVSDIYPAPDALSSDGHQVLHGLKSSLKVYVTLFRDVDPFAAPEAVRANGINYGARVAQFVTRNAVPFTTVVSTLQELVAASKAPCLANERLFALACDVLASECKNAKSDYSTSRN
jgi:hypothetical protein